MEENVSVVGGKKEIGRDLDGKLSSWCKGRRDEREHTHEWWRLQDEIIHSLREVSQSNHLSSYARSYLTGIVYI